VGGRIRNLIYSLAIFLRPRWLTLCNSLAAKAERQLPHHGEDVAAWFGMLWDVGGGNSRVIRESQALVLRGFFARLLIACKRESAL
jgi:hypothetical protein